MLTSKLFLITWAIASLATAYGIWDGSNWIVTPTISIVGGAAVGWFVWFIWGAADKWRKG